MSSFKRGDLMIEGPFHPLFEISWPIRARAKVLYRLTIIASDADSLASGLDGFSRG